MNWDENFINLHYLVFLKFYIFKFAPIPPKAGLIGSNFRGAAHRNSFFYFGALHLNETK